MPALNPAQLARILRYLSVLEPDWLLLERESGQAGTRRGSDYRRGVNAEAGILQPERIMSDDGKVTCPQARRTNNRKRSLRKIWRSKEWKAAVKEFIAGKTCQWCGSTEKLTAHHPYMEGSTTGSYLNLYLSGCLVLCNRCHAAIHHGLEICPICKDHYRPIGTEMCKPCFLKAHPEIVAAREQFEESRKAKLKEALTVQAQKRKALKAEHPCKQYRAGGKCGLSVIGTRCPYSKTKAAAQCGDFEGKKGKVRT